MPSLLNRAGSSRSTVSKEYKCTVQLMDDTQTITVDFKKDDIGQVVVDYVCDMLNVVEKDYFGLRYVDANRHRYWLDTAKPILRQIQSGTPIVFAFRVKYYPIDPSVLHEQLTRYMITLQLKRDLLHGRLYCPQNDAAVLGAYIIQAELGDYDAIQNKGSYASQFKMFLNQTPRLEEKIAIEHQKLKGKGITANEADLEFLQRACRLDTYGYYPFTVKDAKNGQVYVGATPRGLLIYQAHKQLHHVDWNDVKGFDYVGKEFIIYASDDYFSDHNLGEEVQDLNDNDDLKNRENNGYTRPPNRTIELDKNGGKKKPSLRFVCPSATFCKHLWKYMLGQQAFFTKDKAIEVKPIVIRRGPMFRRSTFRYTGRVLQEIKEASSPKRAEPSFERIHIQRQMPRDERNAPWANKFHTLPRAMKPVPEEQTIDLNKTLPTDTTRDSLLLETTFQSTPITTPMSGLSPSSENGPWSTHINGVRSNNLSNGPSEQSYSIVQTSSTKTSTQNVAGGAGSIKKEVITVCLRRTEPIDTEQGQQTFASTQETQRLKAVKIQQHTASTGNGNVFDDGNLLAKANGTETWTKTTIEQRRESATIIVNETDGQGRALMKSIVTGLVFFLLVVTTIIFVMEVQDVEFRQYIRKVTGDDAFRRGVYDPIRQRVMGAFK